MGSRERKIYFQRMHRIGSHRRVFGVPLFVPSKLVELLALYLDSNRLTGQIPTSIGQLTSLLDLRLRANKLTGTLPTELGVLTNLEVCIRCMVGLGERHAFFHMPHHSTLFLSLSHLLYHHAKDIIFGHKQRNHR